MVLVNNESRQVRRYRERKQQKAKVAQDQIERQTFFKIKNILKTVLPEKILYEIAAKAGFQKRERKLTGTALISILLMGCSNGSEDVPIAALDVMCLYLRKWFGINMKKQSLQGRINLPQTATFIKEVMNRVMSYEIDTVLAKLLKNVKKKMSTFARVLIQDSSVISLPETLARIFKGSGGAASKAAVKYDYIIDQTNHLIVKMKCVAGRIPDSSLSGDIIDHVGESDLVIRDLGYFNLTNFSKIIKKRAFFLSRLSKGVLIYLNKDDEQPVNLVEHLEKLGVKHKGVDIDVYVGKKERLSVRLIGVKVPPAVVELRRKQYKKARGRSKEPSESLQEWHGYTLMITNISRSILSLSSILKQYKVRWQIELFFKNMKSIFVVDIMTGENKYRILCLIFTKLAIIWIASLLYAYAQVKIGTNKEVSRFKFSRWLKDIGNLREALCKRDFSNLLEELERDLDLLYREIKKNPDRDFQEGVEDEKVA